MALKYLDKFMKGFSQISESLGALQKDVKFVWTSECKTTFESLKEASISAPVLALPGFIKSCGLTTDASTEASAYI
jgi:hypothetical protein